MENQNKQKIVRIIAALGILIEKRLVSKSIQVSFDLIQFESLFEPKQGCTVNLSTDKAFVLQTTRID